MGGHAGGDVASRIVVEEFARLVEEGYDPLRGAEHVAETLSRSQARIVEYGEGQRARRTRAGTPAPPCVVAVLVDDHGTTKWMLVNLGDSRIYRFNDGRARPGERRPLGRPGARSTPVRSPSRRPPSTPSGT